MKGSARANRGATFTDSPSRRLVEARKQHALVRDPALHRLDFILRQFSVLAVVSSVLDVVGDVRLRGLNDARRALKLGFGSDATAVSWAATLCVRQALGLFLLCAFWRCIKHVQRNEARELFSTMPVLSRIYLWIIATDLVALPLGAIVMQSKPTAQTIDAAFVSVAILGVLYAVVRTHVENAQRALAPRIAAPTPAAPAVRYLSLKYLFLICAGVSVILALAGYVLSGIR